MASDSGLSDWEKRRMLDWRTEPGMIRLRDIIGSQVPFEAADWQLENTARLLMGEDVLCISATGDGKSALIYMYSMVYDNTTTLVVSPTNALEVDMVNNLVKLGISAIAINAETVAAAALERPVPRNLWAEATAGKHNIIFFSPETLADSAFHLFIENKAVRLRLGLFCVDECHLVDEWGADFRKPYASISRVRPWLPEWTSFVALTATLEPGRQTDIVTASLGLYQGRYHFEKRNCERRNVDIVIRTMQYPYTTNVFRDLDWLVPPNVTEVQDIPKTLLYCESIDLGQRVATYLRSLLHQSLHHDKDRVIRHMHSLNCADCKKTGLASLYQCSQQRETGIPVSTDVLGVGLNMHDFDRVVCFSTPSSLSSMIQRIGRASRGRDRHGIGYVYLKKSDVEATAVHLRTIQPHSVDYRLLTIRTAAVEENLSLKKSGETSHQNLSGEEAPEDSKLADTQLRVPTKAKAPKKELSKEVSIPKKKLCPSLRLAIAAHVQGACISRQINIIYQNPNISTDCGRCSSCTPRSTPDPRPLSSDSAMLSLTASGTAGFTTQSKPKDDVPGYLRLSMKDVASITDKIQEAALQIQSSLPMRPEFLFVGYETFLRSSSIRHITTDFHLVTSQDILHERIKDWEYWEVAGSALWEVVDRLGKEMRVALLARHEGTLAKRREATRRNAEQKVRAVLIDAGLANVKRVVLRMSEQSGRHLDKENQIPPDASASLQPQIKQKDSDTSINNPLRLQDNICSRKRSVPQTSNDRPPKMPRVQLKMPVVAAKS